MRRQSVMFLVPIETRTTENQRSGTSRWAKAPKNKMQRKAVLLSSVVARIAQVPAPWVVRLTRIHPPKHKLDDDNVQAALKAVRDAVAEDVLGLPSDRDRRVTFLCAQRLGERWGVEVDIMGPCEVVTTVRDVMPWPKAADVVPSVGGAVPIEDPEDHAARQLRETRGVPGSNDDEIAAPMVAEELKRRRAASEEVDRDG